MQGENIYFTMSRNSKPCFGGPKSYWNIKTKIFICNHSTCSDAFQSSEQYSVNTALWLDTVNELHDASQILQEEQVINVTWTGSHNLPWLGWVCDELDSGSCGESTSGCVILSTFRGKLDIIKLNLRCPCKQHAIISHVGEGVCGVVFSVGGYVVLGNFVTINVTKCIIKLVTNFITEYGDSLKFENLSQTSSPNLVIH